MLSLFTDKLINLIVFSYDLGEMIALAFRDAAFSLRRGIRPVLSVYLRRNLPSQFVETALRSRGQTPSSVVIEQQRGCASPSMSRTSRSFSS